MPPSWKAPEKAREHYEIAVEAAPDDAEAPLDVIEKDILHLDQLQML